jgi:predicted nucleic acid-binding protein
VILADTSVWIDHLRRGNARLTAALEGQEVVTHPFVIGELACGDIHDRRAVLASLHHLPKATEATHDEVLSLVEKRRLMGHGLGYVDVHLLAAVILSPNVRLWTFDAPLAAAASRLGIMY